jgi:anti-sigma B factor antagonist
MQLEMTDLGTAAKVALHGRLDTPGVDQIETRFTASVVAGGRNALVDLSAVSFVSSMGIRMLLTAARSLGQKKAKMVLVGVQPIVRESFEHVGLPDIIPIAADDAQALELLRTA